MSGSDHQQTLVYVIFLCVIIFFVLVGSYMESKHLKFGHETAVVIIVGMLVSLMVSAWDSHDEGKRLVFQFNTAIFFDLLLPAILFAAGYNMRRKEFFKNFVNITKFGIFGSLFTFAIYVGLTKLLFAVVDIEMYDPKTGLTEVFVLDTLEIMVVCSILVSSDIIAAMSILNFEEVPHIYSIILGEGLFNDVVVIVLYQTVKSYQEDPTQVFEAKTALQITGSFCSLCLVSVCVGVGMGFLVTYVLKRVRSVSHSAIHETFLLVCCAMLTYYASELLGQSGITSLVACALVEAHYTWYNLSPQGRHVTSVTF
jgi:NhaP-type Na+/H+ or K+/H+ antiporter